MNVVNWEKRRTTPRINHMVAVVGFLGFKPFQNGDTLTQRLIEHRETLGAAQKDFAYEIGVDPSTLARWERGERTPTGRFASKVTAALNRMA